LLISGRDAYGGSTFGIVIDISCLHAERDGS